jgi:hypothetical protein
MGFSSSGQIRTTGWGSSDQEVIGPVLPANVWTHVVNTYSTTNGVQLYVNGTLINGTGAMNYAASGLVNIITLGNYIQGIQGSAGGSCNSQSIIPNVYSGFIDEFRVYSRELDTADIYALANP